VVALVTGLFLLAELEVGEERFGGPAASPVDKEVGRVLAEFGLVDPTAGCITTSHDKGEKKQTKKHTTEDRQDSKAAEAAFTKSKSESNQEHQQSKLAVTNCT
jgi:hypothetical protein